MPSLVVVVNVEVPLKFAAGVKVTTPPKGQSACRLAVESHWKPPPFSTRVWLTEIAAIRTKKRIWTPSRAKRIDMKRAQARELFDELTVLAAQFMHIIPDLRALDLGTLQEP